MNRKKQKPVSGKTKGKLNKSLKISLVAVLIAVIAGVTIFAGFSGGQKVDLQAAETSLPKTESHAEVNDSPVA